MPIRVELLTHRVNFADPRPLESRHQQSKRCVNAFFQTVRCCRGTGKRHLKAVTDRKQAFSEAFDRIFMRLGNVFLTAAANVFSISFGAQKEIAELDGLGLSACEQFGR